jgi:hypothetical protein
MTPSEGVSEALTLKSVDLALTALPISTKLFSSSSSEILLPAELDGMLLMFTSCN